MGRDVKCGNCRWFKTSRCIRSSELRLPTWFSSYAINCTNYDESESVSIRDFFDLADDMMVPQDYWFLE